MVKVSTAGRAQGVGADPARPYYVMWNRNKRALALNMATEEARAIGLALATRADVLIDNFSPGVLDRWGLGESVLRAANPGLIAVGMSGMGDGGPWSGYVTYAPTIHALSGLTALTGVPGRDDIGIGFSFNDHAAGLHAALAVLAALEARRRDGVGQRIEVAQFETGVNFLGPTLLDLAVNGGRAEATGNRLPYDAAAPHDCYPCRPLAGAVPGEEERWVAIAVMSDGQWRALRALLGEPAWARDPALDSAAGRVAAVEAIDRGDGGLDPDAGRGGRHAALPGGRRAGRRRAVGHRPHAARSATACDRLLHHRGARSTPPSACSTSNGCHCSSRRRRSRPTPARG